MFFSVIADTFTVQGCQLFWLREAHPSAQIFLTGDLTIDLPEEIQVTPEVQAAETLEASLPLFCL